MVRWDQMNDGVIWLIQRMVDSCRRQLSAVRWDQMNDGIIWLIQRMADSCRRQLSVVRWDQINDGIIWLIQRMADRADYCMVFSLLNESDPADVAHVLTDGVSS